jgi:hypothetical protein
VGEDPVRFRKVLLTPIERIRLRDGRSDKTASRSSGMSMTFWLAALYAGYGALNVLIGRL